MAANARAGTGRAAVRIGRDSVMTLAGTDVAAARLTKPLIETGLSIAAGSLTCPVLICRR
jgi:hypothetical protein